MSHGLFITGTSTDVGKTFVGALIARKLAQAGQRVGVYKPVESGCLRKGETLIAADAQMLWEAAGKPGELPSVCPQRFEAPLAPPPAAALAGTVVDAALLRTGLDYWQKRSDIVLVEGAGGLMSPLSNTDYNIDLAKEFGFPLVIVSVNALGTINATLQTLVTARTLAPQLPIAGVILNQTQKCPSDVSVRSNAAELRARCDVPVLATVDFGQSQLHETIDWF